MSGLLRAIAALSALFALVGCSEKQTTRPAAIGADLRAQVREVLLQNPEILEEAQSALQARRREEARRSILADGRHFSTGPKDAPVTVIAFFDYQCPYCKAAGGWMGKARQRAGVRMIFVEFPIQGEGSVLASRAAVAAVAQGRYLPFHAALLAHKGALSPEVIETIANEVGLDVRRLRRDMQDLAVDALLRNNYRLAERLGVKGTPSFFVNEIMVPSFEPKALAAAMRDAEG